MIIVEPYEKNIFKIFLAWLNIASKYLRWNFDLRGVATLFSLFNYINVTKEKDKGLPIVVNIS